MQQFRENMIPGPGARLVSMLLQVCSIDNRDTLGVEMDVQKSIFAKSYNKNIGIHISC